MNNRTMRQCAMFLRDTINLQEEYDERGSYDQESRVYSGRLLKSGINSAPL
jgi:hypothetical protein